MPVGRRGSANALRKAGRWPMARSFRSRNEALFSVLGTTYGGNGTTTFNLPDLVGRTIAGVGTDAEGTTTTLGEQFGTTALR